MDDETRKRSTTTSGQPPVPGLEGAGAPGPIDPKTGMHTAYWVLTAEERAKGFVRPVRNAYLHVGIAGPTFQTRALTPEEELTYSGQNYIAFEVYPPEMSPRTGRFWTSRQLAVIGKGCRTVTTMGSAIAETYARQPSYYGSTFCAGCRTHLPVGEAGEFVWAGTEERVGT